MHRRACAGLAELVEAQDLTELALLVHASRLIGQSLASASADSALAIIGLEAGHAFDHPAAESFGGERH